MNSQFQTQFLIMHCTFNELTGNSLRLASLLFHSVTMFLCIKGTDECTALTYQENVSAFPWSSCFWNPSMFFLSAFIVPSTSFECHLLKHHNAFTKIHTWLLHLSCIQDWCHHLHMARTSPLERDGLSHSFEMSFFTHIIHWHEIFKNTYTGCTCRTHLNYGWWHIISG